MKKDEILSILRKFKNDSAEKYGIVELGIFGSVARDEAREDSDVDICIKTRTPDPFALVHIKEEIEKLVNRHVEIVRMRDTMNPFLKERINKEGLYV